MPLNSTADWDDAYTNGAYIKGGAAYPARWKADALAFREKLSGEGRLDADIAYGPHERNGFDLFKPSGSPKGLVVFVHGGYWLQFDKSSWSHLAAGPLSAGFAVAMPSYVLCPEARIAGITRQIGAAITAAAAEIAGPIHLAGHSAGGHLVSRMVSATTPLERTITSRIAKTVSISGVHDLRPLMKTSMNETLGIDNEEAQSESPAWLAPLEDASVTFWVGGDERPEFLRQNALMAKAWASLGDRLSVVEEPGRNHFDIIDGLKDANHPLATALLTV